MSGISFRRAGLNDADNLKTLWLSCFDEDPRAFDLLFDYHSSFSVYCAQSGEKIVSALYLWHCSLNGQKAHYLFGASTLPDFRGQKIMARLINFSLEQAKKEGCVYSLLLPASESLYSFYSSFGYLPNCFKGERTFERSEIQKNTEIISENPNFEKLQKICFKNDFLLQSEDFFKFSIDYYKIYGIKSVTSGECFALFYEEGKTARVFYSVYTDFSALCSLILQKTQAEKFIFTQNSGNLKSGMIKALDSETKIPQNVYIGITFE